MAMVFNATFNNISVILWTSKTVEKIVYKAPPHQMSPPDHARVQMQWKSKILVNCCPQWEAATHRMLLRW